MSEPSLPIGIIPNQFWPAPEPDGHANRLYMNEPTLRVLLDVYSKPTRSPLHIHTHIDRFIFVAHGTLSLVSRRGRLNLHAQDAVVLPANLPHGVLVDDHASVISILIGPLAPHSLSRLPPDLCNQLQPHTHHLHLPSWPMSHPNPLYEDFEQETLAWAKEHLAQATSPSTCPIDITPHKDEPEHHLDAWKTPHAFLLKTSGYSYGFHHNLEPGIESIQLNRISTMKHALDQSDQKVPRMS